MKRSVFDTFPWWDQGDVLTQITPARFAYLREAADRLEGTRVLDLGCGGGLLAEPMAQAGARVAGVDISGSALRAASAHARQSRLEIDYLLSPAERLPLRDEAFDTVVAFDVLEHMENLPAAIGEIARVLRPGGRFIYDTMNRTLLCRLMVIWIGERLWKGGPPSGTHDWRRFIKPKELVGMLASNGIVNLQTRGFVPRGIDRRGRLRMGFSPYQGLSYVGYGIKDG